MTKATEQAGAPDLGEPLDQRLLAPRMFNLLGVIRRVGVRSVRQELGLSDFEWVVMSHVGAKAMTFNDLTAVIGHDKGQLSRGVKGLVEAGLLTRQRRRASRNVVIAPTAAGREVFERLIAMAIAGDEALARGISRAELDTFVRVMERLMANACDMLGAEQARAAPSPAPEPAPIEA